MNARDNTSLFEGAIKVLTAAQIRQADAYTILHEPIRSLDLMERAASLAAAEIEKKIKKEQCIDVVCGPGNNGGDGLVIARLLHLKGYKVCAYLVNESLELSEDCNTSSESLRKLKDNLLNELKTGAELPDFPGDVVVDALFGTGLSRKIGGMAAAIIEKINQSKATVIAVDIPSGLYADAATPADYPVVHADYTLTFQTPKLCFFFAMNEQYVGEWKVLDIGLHKEFIGNLDSNKYYVTKEQVEHWMEPRAKFSHKGNFGHAFLVAGSEGMLGAAILSATACLRTGTGLLTAHIPKSGVPVFLGTLPEAMVHADSSDQVFTGLDENETDRATAIGAGPGLSGDERTQEGMRQLIKQKKPMVLDADALNILSAHPDLLDLLQTEAILTPHPKEFERLAGKSEDDFQRHEKQISFSMKYGVITVLKGAHSCIAFPDGSCCFNSTGNPAMATGGSGDVLTGVILGLLAQGFSPGKAAIAGVYVHGLAGDLAVQEIGKVGLLASDIVSHIPAALMRLCGEDGTT